jgi:hypothetical protein
LHISRCLSGRLSVSYRLGLSRCLSGRLSVSCGLSLSRGLSRGLCLRCRLSLDRRLGGCPGVRLLERCSGLRREPAVMVVVAIATTDLVVTRMGWTAVALNHR